MTAELPPRPEPPRRSSEAIQAWLAWFGVARLIVSALCVVIVAAGVAWLVRTPAPTSEAGLPFTTGTTGVSTPPTLPTPPTVPTTTAVVDERPVVVHVAGSVVAPGVSTLEPGARIQDAIAAAGGATPSADLDGVNLASPVTDGQRIYVPEVGEVDPWSVPSGGSASGDDGAGGGESIPVGPIDLNTATAAQLESLPGVGPATAAAIVDDRERHGPFAAVTDLERVPGIGPAKLAAIADRVTV